MPTIQTDNIVEFDEIFFGNLASGGAVCVIIDPSRDQTEVTIEGASGKCV